MSLKLDAVTKITPRIIRILGFNPGLMTLQGTNTYVIGNGQRLVIIYDFFFFLVTVHCLEKVEDYYH